MKSIYHDLDQMKLVAIHQAIQHNCNYNIIISNPNEKGEFDLSKGSTYEMVTDSYFDKDRPNAKLIHKTDDLRKEEIVANMIDRLDRSFEQDRTQNENPILNYYNTNINKK